MPTFTLESQGAALGNEFMTTVQESFNTPDWMRICVTIRDQVFKLGEMGQPHKMMLAITDLEAGIPIQVEIPYDIKLKDGSELDVAALMVKLDVALVARQMAADAFLKKRRKA